MTSIACPISTSNLSDSYFPSFYSTTTCPSASFSMPEILIDDTTLWNPDFPVPQTTGPALFAPTSQYAVVGTSLPFGSSQYLKNKYSPSATSVPTTAFAAQERKYPVSTRQQSPIDDSSSSYDSHMECMTSHGENHMCPATEHKLKRREQNRAAQRAFRHRQTQRLKELEKEVQSVNGEFEALQKKYERLAKEFEKRVGESWEVKE